jgi:hypothetical protein
MLASGCPVTFQQPPKGWIGTGLDLTTPLDVTALPPEVAGR